MNHMPTRTIRGASLFYTDTAPGSSAIPLVLLHGFPLDSRIWSAQVTALAPHARVITVDLRGFGQSSSTRPFTMESLADDVHDLLQSIGALPCVLGGLSMGGYVALAHAEKYPVDLKALALIDTRAESDNPAGQDARNRMIELARTGGAPAVADQMQPRMLAETTLRQKPEIVHRLRQIMEACPPLTIEHASAAMRDRPDRTPILSNIRVPVLIVVGDSDVITPPAMAESMRQRIPQATLTVIANAGHMSPMEQPEQVNDALRQFLGKMKP
jgi:pimeloyl-ACP methyl ester carboxylesterase